MKQTKRIETNISVLDAAKQRIKNVFASGLEIYLGFSGGKDSIVLLDIIYKLIQKGEIDAGKLNVFFMDEEAMFDDVIRITKKWRKRIIASGGKFLWFCMEYKHFNCLNTLSANETFICWDRYKKDVWVRQMPQFAITHHPLFRPRKDSYQDFCARVFSSGVNIQGLRTAESLQRKQFINRIAKKRETKENTSIYPIYDWKDSDVWKYIRDNGLEIPDTYQYLWEIGTHLNRLRISQFFSIDTAKVLSKLNEFYPDLMERVCRREPNAYLVSLYIDSEMFRKNTAQRRKMEEGQEKKDYKALVLDILKKPNKYRLGVSKQVFTRYKATILEAHIYFQDEHWKTAYEALMAGDPKMRTQRALAIRSRSKYDNANVTSTDS